jgi:hypothetical protein
MHTLSAMISPSQRAQIKAEIAKLEEDRKICNEAGIRKVIEGWIEEQKKKLAEGMREDPYAGPAIFSVARPTERRRWGGNARLGHDPPARVFNIAQFAGVFPF